MGRRRKRRPGEPDGVLLVDKPTGPTSADVVRRLRRALNVGRIGHTGTLDPLATGLLPICIGRATRLAQFLTADDKRYVATVRLGVGTDTLDSDGQTTREDPPEEVAAVDEAAVRRALEGFLGTITQRPPAYSAIKVDGKRLHELARAGEAVEAPEREVTVHALELLRFESPDLDFEVHCSKGTYVRSLARDLGLALGLGAHLTALRRTESGALRVDGAQRLEDIEADPSGARLLGMADSMGHLPRIDLDDREVEDLRQGRWVEFAEAPPGLCRAVAPDGDLVALVDVPERGPAPIVRGFPAGE